PIIAINGWENQRIDTSVPAGAETGPVVVSNGNVNPSNSLPFTVGDCVGDDECALGDQCCSSGTFWSGICRLDGTCDAGAPTACEFSWSFSTAPDPAPPLTCSGYTSANQCLAAGNCPNSPGECQTSTDITVGKGCGSAYCNTAYAQCGGNCAYDAVLNRCKNADSCDATNNTLITGYTAECREGGSAGIWQINTNGASCPLGSYLDANRWCTVGTIGNSSSCDLCASDFSCLAGECVINNQICPKNSTCDLTAASPNENECVSNNDICECCCRVANSAEDCCLGLTCTAGGCGSDPVNYGLCSGCRVELDGDNNTITSSEQGASDAACNCSGTTGKYCDLTSNPSGVCLDFGPLNSSCSNGGACSAGAVCGQGLFCDSSKGCTCQQTSPAGGPCDSDASNAVCDPLDAMCAVGSICDVNTCTCKPTGAPIGFSCNAPAYPQCVLANFCIQGLQCLTETPFAACGNCCCDMDNDQCGLINSVLACRYDTGSGGACDDTTQGAAPDFGLCCGCSTDSQCGTPNFTGCSIDTCCRARPSVTAVFPADQAVDICRNAMITATFDQKMDVASFSGNVIVLGDYGTGQCPKGTQYLIGKAAENNQRFLARIISKAIGLLRKALNPIMPGVWAQAANYCAITGTVSGYQNADETTTLAFSPKELLAPAKVYYAIIKGDSNVSDSEREGVQSIYGVSMSGGGNQIFNGVKYSGEIWSFTTMSEQAPNNGVCKISRVEVSPSSYLFQTTDNDSNEDDVNVNAQNFDIIKDKDKVFVAKAITQSGQQITEIAGVYEWIWSWTNANNTVVQ
ncbi:MAG: Ig-like domain-containing protein, partial [Patescibacteria group bacterium]